MSGRLYLKVVLSLAVALAVTVTPFAWWIGRSQGRLYAGSLRETALVVARIQAENAAHLLLIGEYAGLEQQLLDDARLPGVQSIHLIEPDGRIVANVHRDSEEAAPRIHYPLEIGWVPPGEEAFLEERPGAIVAWAPIVGGGPLGWVQTTYGLHRAEEMQGSFWRQTLLLGAAWLAVAVLVVTLVLRRPMRAIRELSLFARDLARRKGERLPVRRGTDEIAMLAGALDHASVELATSERQLLAERERLAITLQSLGEGVLACDREGRITLMNGEAERITGWTAGEAVGRPFEEVFRVVDPRSGEPLAAPLQAAIDTGHAVAPGVDAVLEGHGGARRHFSDDAAPIVDGAGKVIGAVVVFRDETERFASAQHQRELEGQLRHAQKMEAVGQLAGGIAHDFNNLLTGIIGYGSLLLEMTPAGDARREPAEEVLQAARRATTLTRGLLAFSRKQRMELRLVDLNDVVRGVERMLRRIIGEEVELRTTLDPDPLIVDADAAQLEQVLLNLATNARDAMPGGGLLGLTSQRVELDEPALAGARPALRGRFALLAVSDTGTGMEPATLERIFEPFFTTKGAGHGTGLGLPIVLGIVEQHGGAIRVESAAAVGTTFKIYLPLDAGAPAEDAAATAAPPRGGSERILLVEDEAEVRRVARAILERGGYRVVEAADGAEALALVERGGEPFRLVVSDVVMPRMSGRELRQALRTTRPFLPVLFISGYTPDLIQRRGLLDADDDLLLKPFTAPELLARVRAALDG